MIAHNFEVRKALYEQIEKERGSKVINYVTGDPPRFLIPMSIKPDVMNLFVAHLDELGPIDKLTLILYTAGGDIGTAWCLVNLLRVFCKELEIVVISKALSAGTLMCLGANKIVMTRQAVLGPIDPSVNNPLNPQSQINVEDVQGYLDLVKETVGINDSNSLMQVLIRFSEQVQPLVLGQVFRARKQIRMRAEKLLDHQKTKNGKKKSIVSFLCGGCGSHDYKINRREAKDLGLVVEEPSEEFYPILKKLQSSIDDTLQLRSVFSNDTELAEQPEATGRRWGMIESAAHGCHHYVSGIKPMELQSSEPGQQPQVGIQDNRTLEGWRKEA